MVLGIAPVIGIPLPFCSAGGTSGMCPVSYTQLIYCMGGSGYFTEKSDGEIYDSVKRQLAAEKERIYKKHPDLSLIHI